MNIKKLICVALTAIMLFPLAACGKSGKNPSETPGNPSQSADEAGKPKKEVELVTYALGTDPIAMRK